MIQKIIKWALIIISIWLLTHFSIMLSIGMQSTHETADMIVIFGNKVETDGKPSQRLQERLDAGIALFNNKQASNIIVSGGTGSEGFDEATVMKEYLIEKGIPEKNIITDSQGNTTYLTAKNLAHMNEKSVILVSQYYHLMRAQLAMKRFGFKTVYTAHAILNPELRDLYSIPREIVGYYYYLLRSYD